MTKEKIILIGKFPPIISLLEASTYVVIGRKVLGDNEFLSFVYSGGYNLYDSKNLFCFRDLNHIKKLIKLVSNDLEKFEQSIIKYINETQKFKISREDSLTVTTLNNFGKSLIFQSLPYAFEQMYQIANLKSNDLDSMLIRFAKVRSKADIIQKDNEIWFREQIQTISKKQNINAEFITYNELLYILTSGIIDENIKKNIEKREKNYVLDYNSSLNTQERPYLIHYSPSIIYNELYSLGFEETNNKSVGQIYRGKVLSKGVAKGFVYNYNKKKDNLIPNKSIIIADYIDLHDMEKISV